MTPFYNSDLEKIQKQTSDFEYNQYQKINKIRYSFYKSTEEFNNFNKGKIKADLTVTPFGQALFVEFSNKDKKAIIEQFEQYCFKL
jgi:hypothetical protein